MKYTHVKREELKYINNSAPLRSKLTKFIECHHDEVLGLCTKLVIICQRQRNWPNLIGCSGQTVLNLKHLWYFFIKHGLKIMCAKFRDEWTKCVIGVAFLRVLDINQDGGKSIMAQNDVIGCVELGLVQGIQWYLVCEYWMNGSKVINFNACTTLTCWWR